MQATCEKALRAVDSWTPGTRLDSWMLQIMQNHWIDTLRRERPQTPLDAPAALAVAAKNGEQAVEARLTLSLVGRVIDQMPEDQRAVLVLVCVEELNYREAAEVLDVPIGTVMSRLARARRTIIEATGEESQDAKRRTGEAK